MLDLFHGCILPRSAVTSSYVHPRTAQAKKPGTSYTPWALPERKAFAHQEICSRPASCSSLTCHSEANIDIDAETL
jgi:hypothetical protein